MEENEIKIGDQTGNSEKGALPTIQRTNWSIGYQQII